MTVATDLPPLVIATRFGLGMKDERWLENRLALISAITVPSLANQTDPDFRWLLFVDPDMPPRIRAALDDALAPVADRVELDETGEFRNRALIAAAERLSPGRYLLTARIDDDDAWQPETAARIRAAAAEWLAAGGDRRGVGFTFSHGVEWLMHDMVDVHRLVKSDSRVARPAGVRDYVLPFHSMSVFVMSEREQPLTAISAGHGRIEQVLQESDFDTSVLATDEPMWLYCRHKQTMSTLQKARGEALDLGVADLARMFGLDGARTEQYLAASEDVPYVVHKHALYRRNRVKRELAGIERELASGAEPARAADLEAQRAQLSAELERVTVSVTGKLEPAATNGEGPPTVATPEPAPAAPSRDDREQRTPERWNTRGGFNIHDVFALEALRPLGGNYVPWTGYALSPRSLLRVINVAMLHEAQFIVEAGAGISTVFLARYLRQWGGDDARIVSVDDNGPWIEKIRRYIEREDLGDLVELVTAPLGPWSVGAVEPAAATESPWRFEVPEEWYETAGLREAVSDRKIDLLLVDGPKGRGTISRYPAVHELLGNIDKHTIVVLDDIRRDMELEILARWSALAGLEFNEQENTTIAIGHARPRKPG
jgi:Putative rhamnosyl transferase/Methyltransferase domain